MPVRLGEYSKRLSSVIAPHYKHLTEQQQTAVTGKFSIQNDFV